MLFCHVDHRCPADRSQGWRHVERAHGRWPGASHGRQPRHLCRRRHEPVVGQRLALQERVVLRHVLGQQRQHRRLVHVLPQELHARHPVDFGPHLARQPGHERERGAPQRAVAVQHVQRVHAGAHPAGQQPLVHVPQPRCARAVGAPLRVGVSPHHAVLASLPRCPQHSMHRLDDVPVQPLARHDRRWEGGCAHDDKRPR
mmetsp:Transcript_23403/g.59908  ORF Transcript_23403/g.59908 Transcript_23403/m.59908 type:complete len:200 (-) Transcript_23403:340-939(-)